MSTLEDGQDAPNSSLDRVLTEEEAMKRLSEFLHPDLIDVIMNFEPYDEDPFTERQITNFQRMMTIRLFDPTQKKRR